MPRNHKIPPAPADKLCAMKLPHPLLTPYPTTLTFQQKQVSPLSYYQNTYVDILSNNI